MKDKCSCGFIIQDKSGKILICHPTYSKVWDFPKGNANPGEDHLEAAFRELREETGLILEDYHYLIDLGQHPYQSYRDLHLFFVKVDSVDTSRMVCESMVTNTKGADFPEVDKFIMVSPSRVYDMVGNSMKAWLKNFVVLFNGENNVKA